jgi:hypothetical protein
MRSGIPNISAHLAAWESSDNPSATLSEIDFHDIGEK